MASDTRDKLLAAAQELFARRGFDGVSIAAIAERLNLSKQTLLYHFSSKEKLYGEVLARISRDFEVRLTRDNADVSDATIAELLIGFAEDSRHHREQTALLMRELLDNGSRAAQAGRWYLAGFLNTLMDRVQALPQWRKAPRAQVAARVYQLLGAINYFAISADTLRAMLGAQAYRAMEAAFDEQLRELSIAALARPGAAEAGARPRGAGV